MRIAKLVPLAVFLVPLAAFGATVNVTVSNFAFTPSSVTIAPGDTVQWNFTSLHSSTSDATTGPEVWNSGLLSTGSFSHTFATVGTWTYHCSLHTFMKGSVQVASAVTITSVNPPTALPGATVTISGTGFQSGATVTFGGVASPSVTFVNATTLQAVVPNIPPGAATVVVTNPDTTSASFGGFVVTSLAVPALSAAFLLLLAAVLAAVGLLSAR